MYEVCPYKDAHQRDGGAATSLGAWKGFEDSYSSMMFSGGQHCWNGPQRSIKARRPVLCAFSALLILMLITTFSPLSLQVTLECGVEEILKHVQEPNRCEYAATLVTPAACDAQLAEQLQAQVREAELATHDEL